LIHDMLLAAGLANYQTRPGWRSLPLEELVYAPPELIAAAFFDTQPHKTGAWSSMRHPVATTQLQQRPVVSLNGAWTSCGAWFLIDAIEALAQGDRS
ncbi:MAG: ABC transporter substrate-binding protein, partial [Henriciella sp.]